MMDAGAFLSQTTFCFMNLSKNDIMASTLSNEQILDISR